MNNTYKVVIVNKLKLQNSKYIRKVIQNTKAHIYIIVKKKKYVLNRF